MSILNPFGTAASSGESLPIGSVIMWAGTLDTIPTGWHLCNGEDGTIDLCGMFALGAGGTYNLGDTGGSEEVTLTIEQMPSHGHGVRVSTASGSMMTGRINADVKNMSTGDPNINTAFSGSSQPHPNMPPYKALYYIQKIAGTNAPSSGGGSGTLDHNNLTNRNLPDQHPTNAITGLSDILNKTMSTENVLSTEEILEIMGE